MKRDLAALANQLFDALIVGGGILGAGIARDAALRGLRVALIDKGDFAGGTSSASSKLIHGGFRYLEQGNFHLVREASRERAILQRIAPHLVRPLPMLFPVYEGDRHPLWQIRLAAKIYGWLSRQPASLIQEPALNPTGLRGTVVLHDCQEDDARFCLDNIRHAADLGAVCANYCELTGKTRVLDRLTNGSFDVSASVVVNAAGPWVPRVAALFGHTGLALSPTKGIHLLVPRLSTHAIIFQARHDGRILFVLPWGECSIVGTTDTDWHGDPGDAHAQAEDVEYLLRELRRLFPDCRPEIITTFAGVRALLPSPATPSRRSREHRIVRQDNVIHVLGGKYTTYRLVAEQVVNQLTDKPCATATTPLPEYKRGDVAYYCEHEMAQTVSDVMRRRTGLALSRQGGEETAREVARQMSVALGRNMDASLKEYLDDRDRASRF